MDSNIDVLPAMEGELTWALEESTDKRVEPYVLRSAVPDCGEFPIIELESRGSTAVCTEGEAFFENTLDQVEQGGWIQTLDPRHLAFRPPYRGTGVRRSLIPIREDQVPSHRNLFGLPFMVRCDNDVLHLHDRAAGIAFTNGGRSQEGCRSKSEGDAAASATVSRRRSHHAGPGMARRTEVALTPGER